MNILCTAPVDHIAGVREVLDSVGEVWCAENFYEVCRPIFAPVIFCNPNNQAWTWNALTTPTSTRCIVTASTGLTHIDLDFCKARGIEVISLRGDPVLKRISSTAEHAFGLMLAALRHYPAAMQAVQDGEWDYRPHVGRQLDGLTVGVVGYGRLGKMMAGYCKAFGMKVLVREIHDSRFEELDPLPFWPVTRGELIRFSDVISLHIPADGNERLVDASWFAHMKPDAVLVNTSRGEVVDEAALLDWLAVSPYARYAADVLTGEQGARSASLVWQNRANPQILLTPHLGGSTREGLALGFTRAAELLKEWADANL